MPSIIVNKLYLPYLYALGRKWPCTSITHRMSINKIPSVVAYLSTGEDVLHPSQDYDPVQIVRSMQERSTLASSRMAYCELWESPQSGGKPQLKFKGYIVSASLVMQAGSMNGTGKVMVQVNCMGLAVRLYDSPACQYLEATMETLKNGIMYEDVLGEIAAAQKLTGEVHGNNKANLLMLVSTHPMVQAGVPVSRMLAYAVAMSRASVLADMYRDIDELPPDPVVSAVIGGSLRLRRSVLIDEDARVAYAKQMVEQMVDGIKQGSIWDNILKIATSNDFLLQLVPKMSVDSQDDHKMKVMATDTWSSGQPLVVLPSSGIISINMSTGTLEDINSPAVVFVNFADAFSFKSKGNAVGILGVAAADPQLNRTLQAYNKDAGLDYLFKNTNMDAHISVRMVTSPAWMKGLLPYAEINETGKPPKLKTKTPQANAKDLANAQKQKKAEKKPGYKYTAKDIANAYALAKLVHDFKKGDAISVQVDPGFRNYWTARGAAIPLEDCIGSTIELQPAIRSSKTAGTRLGKIRGVLASLSYNCNVGNNGSASYVLTLNRVRLVDGYDLYTGASPLYTY